MMKRTIQQINRKVAKRSYLTQVFVFIILSFAITFPFAPLLYMGENLILQDFTILGKNAWFSIIILGPIVETLIYQHGIFRIINAIPQTRKKHVLYILISASVFGLMHWYDFNYIVFAFTGGVIFAYVYYFYHKSTLKAVGTTILIHSVRNLTALLFIL
jgi:uncharacterized protein